jgi:tetratricopeptide (TPR) repeat protein
MGHARRASYLVQWGKLDEALEVVERVESMSPGQPFSQGTRWMVSMLRDEWDRAEAAANQIKAARDPMWKFFGHRFHALIRLYQGRSREGLDLLEQAALAYEEPSHNSASARVSAAEVLLELGDVEAALEQARRAQREGKGNTPEWEGLFLEALSHAKLGHRDDAEKTVSKFEERTGSLPTQKKERRLHQLLGVLALERGDTQTAIAELTHAESMLPPRVAVANRVPHVPIWFSLGRAQLEAGEPAVAAEWFERLTENPNGHGQWPVAYVRSFYFLGKIYEDLGEMEVARRYYRRFYEYWKDGDMDRERVAESMRKIGGT